MVSHRQRRNLYTGSKLHGQFEGRLGGPSPLIRAANALNASVTQLQKASYASPVTTDRGSYQWYELFPDLTPPNVERGILVDRKDQQAKVALMRIPDEKMQGEDGALAHAKARCRELGLMAANGETPTPEQHDFAVAMEKVGDKHARYHAVVREQNVPQR